MLAPFKQSKALLQKLSLFLNENMCLHRAVSQSGVLLLGFTVAELCALLGGHTLGPWLDSERS